MDPHTLFPPLGTDVNKRAKGRGRERERERDMQNSEFWTNVRYLKKITKIN